MSGRRDSTCQKNDLPKSLQGTEDAEFVWSMIVERFPNAAPLLFEMEAVIDRAEDLLEQLRAPCCREIETSTSFCTPESESTSMISARGSAITENENVEHDVSQCVAEVQVSECKMCGDNDSIDRNRDSMSKEQGTGNESNESCTMCEKSLTPEDSSPLKADTHTDQRTKEARSLEEWEKVVNNALRKSTIDDNQSSRGPVAKKQAQNEDRKETNIEERETSCIVLHRQEIRADVGDSTIEINSEQIMDSQEVIDVKDEAMNVSFKGSGDESSQKFPEQRTPLSILETYAEHSNTPVDYEYVTDGPHRYKSNVYVIRGYLCGYAATGRGDSEESAKNDLALKILQMIANQQMDDDKPGALKDLSKEEMLEIITFGMDSSRETTQRKLYQLCLEKGEQVPSYCVKKTETCQGLTYVATCSALGYTSEGRGLRKCVAKKSAAEELYRQYNQDKRLGLKVRIEAERIGIEGFLFP